MKHDWQKICDGFAKELKQFLEKNNYKKFSLFKNTEIPNQNVDFLIDYLNYYKIPLNTGVLNNTDFEGGNCIYSTYNNNFYMECFSLATICPITRSQQFINNYWRTEYLLSTIHPLTWAFESDIKEMSKVIEFEYISDNSKNLSADQLEWVELQDLNYKIIRGETDPSKNPRWLGYTADQRELVAKVYSIHLANKNNFQGMEEIDNCKYKYS